MVIILSPARAGDDTITVEAGDDTTTPPDMTASPVGVSRELPTGPVAQGEKFTVTITDTGYGGDFELLGRSWKHCRLGSAT